MRCGVGRRRSLDLAFLWLWSRLVATALIRPLFWEPPYAAGAALKRQDGKKKKSKKEKFIRVWIIYCMYLRKALYYLIWGLHYAIRDDVSQGIKTRLTGDNTGTITLKRKTTECSDP